MQLMGYDVVIDDSLDDCPRMVTSSEFNRLMTPELVAETNAWMRKFFGTEMRTYVMDQRRVIAMGSRGFKAILAAQSEGNRTP